MPSRGFSGPQAGGAKVGTATLPIGPAMWNYVLRYRLLLRVIYRRSTPMVGE